jgi:glucose/arabinose dehydrogenase
VGNPLTARNVWYGYPTCFAVWDPSSFSGLKTGSNFVVSPNSSYNDASCNGKATPPRLSFQAHSAPIWNTFDTDAKNMYVAFHGSWDRQPRESTFSYLPSKFHAALYTKLAPNPKPY